MTIPAHWNERTAAIAVTGCLSAAFVAVLSFTGGTTQGVAVFPLIALLLILLTSFELALFGLIVCLFVDVHLSIFSSAVWYSLFALVAFVLHNPELPWRRFANPLTIPLVVYGICIIPSFTNALQPMESLLRLFNVAGFLIAFYVCVAGMNSRERIRRAAAVFLACVVANALHVLVQGFMDQARPFGFAGIMFVDYAGLGISVATALAILSRGGVRIMHSLVAATLAVALVITQTRSIWLATAITLVLVGLSMLMFPWAWNMSRKYAFATVAAGALALLGAGAATLSLSQRTEERALEVTQLDANAVTDEGVVRNSLVSRALIWDTALNAFRAHPFVGIGVYGFPYSSAHYAKMPRILYTRYVKVMSPHQSHLAVLSETGIIGTLGFLGFLFAAFRTAVRAVRSAPGDRGRRFAVVATVALVYCMISMFFTDAWLWGQGIVLFGIVTGIVAANAKVGVVPTGREA